MHMKRQKTSIFVFSIASSLATLAFINTVPLWSRFTNGVILDSWANVLWAANLSLVAQIAGNIVLLIRRPARLYAILQAAMTAVSLVSILVFLIVFPIDFNPVGSGWLNVALKIVMVVGLALGALSLVMFVVRAAVGASYEDERPRA